MEKNRAVVTAITLFFNLACPCNTNLRSNFYLRCYEMDNRIYSGGLLNEIQVKSGRQCLVLCISSENCNTIFYNPSSNQCKLFDYHLGDNETANLSGWQCWSVFKGCGSPPEVPDANVTSDGSFLNAVASYMCKPDFRSCSSPSQSRCQDIGEWTPVTVLCYRYRWEKPTVPFEQALPSNCTIPAVRHVKVKATPTQETWMSFAFLRGVDVLVTMSFRFKYSTDIRQVIMNTAIGGSWSSEYRPVGFPFIVNTSFVLDMQLRNGTYRVSVGERTWYYPERIPGAEPETLLIRRDVRIEWVEILN